MSTNLKSKAVVDRLSLYQLVQQKPEIQAEMTGVTAAFLIEAAQDELLGV